VTQVALFSESPQALVMRIRRWSRPLGGSDEVLLSDDVIQPHGWTSVEEFQKARGRSDTLIPGGVRETRVVRVVGYPSCEVVQETTLEELA
jgi:hypothetical protein